MNKFKFWGVVAGIATFISIAGYWFKIMHHAYADLLLTIGLWSLAISAGIYFYFKFLSLKK
jgi:hypothetical protein